ncbi:Butyrate kinase [Clostridiaceae bacterium JG1575]|nr:Butyrate kinase [Clostridiaceae bacterium JG1575]
MKKLLIINPGSTSTKIGVYEDETPVLIETLRHSAEEVGRYEHVSDQFEFRKEVILSVLKEKGIELESLSGVVGRGGLLRPIPSGTYAVNDAMLRDVTSGENGEHAANLGCMIAREIGDELSIPSFIVDPVVVDELQDVARISGLPLIERKSIFHALNQKAVAKRYAKEVGKRYDELNLIVVHMGGGVSIGAHEKGQVVDVNNALNGEGPYSPERSGGLPVADLVKLCFSGKYTEGELLKKITGKGGVVAYLGTNNMIEVQERMDAMDPEATLVFQGMAYQTAKEIGACAAVLCGKVDQILLTGGIAYSKPMVEEILRRVAFIAPVTIYPGEDELLALAQGGLRVLNGEEEVMSYQEAVQ